MDELIGGDVEVNVSWVGDNIVCVTETAVFGDELGMLREADEESTDSPLLCPTAPVLDANEELTG